GKPEEAETNRGSFRLDEDGRAVAQTKTSWISASGLDVHAGSGDLQLSSHADADSEVCLKGAQRPELHASGRNQNKYQTPRTRESATKRAGPCSIEIFQHPAMAMGSFCNGCWIAASPLICARETVLGERTIPAMAPSDLPICPRAIATVVLRESN